jgi:sigma-B regulation protein RsbU (phosphoserine phosphatase)
MSWEALVPRIGLLLVTAEMMGRLVDDRNRHLDQLRRLIPLQNALAPVTPPELPLLDIATRYVPATSSVGGDFYLITEGHNNSTVIVIADVVGKGMEAAKRATFVRATLSASAAYSQDPAHLLRVANAELIRQYGVSAQFITMLCAVIGPDGSLAWCTAGHPPPVRLADGSGVGAPATSFPLGIAPELERLDVWRGPLPEGGIVLYTDGLTDARPPGGTFEPFGHHRVGMFLRELDHPTPEQAVQRLTEAAQRFAGGVLNDDLCLVAVRSRLAKRVTADGRERAADLPGEAPQPATPQPVR